MGSSTSHLKYIETDINIPNITIKETKSVTYPNKETTTFICPNKHLNCSESRCWW
jgi:hypothetical protein